VHYILFSILRDVGTSNVIFKPNSQVASSCYMALKLYFTINLSKLVIGLSFNICSTHGNTLTKAQKDSIMISIRFIF